MNAPRLVTTAIVCLAMASLSFSAEPKSWAAPLVAKVARIQVGFLDNVTIGKVTKFQIVPFMSVEGRLVRAITTDMTQCKLLTQKDIMLEPGPFLILRSETGRVLGVCHLPLDGGFIPFEFSVRRGMIIQGDRLTKRRTRYGNLPCLTSCWPLHSIWMENAASRRGPNPFPLREAKAPAKTGPPWR